MPSSALEASLLWRSSHSRRSAHKSIRLSAEKAGLWPHILLLELIGQRRDRRGLLLLAKAARIPGLLWLLELLLLKSGLLWLLESRLLRLLEPSLLRLLLLLESRRTRISGSLRLKESLGLLGGESSLLGRDSPGETWLLLLELWVKARLHRVLRLRLTPLRHRQLEEPENKSQTVIVCTAVTSVTSLKCSPTTSYL